MAQKGNLRIHGDEGPDHREEETTFEGDDALKIMTFFNENLNEEAAIHKFKVKFIENPPKIILRAQYSDRKTIEAVVKRLNFLLDEEIFHENVNGNSETTLESIKTVIRTCNLKQKVLPIPNENKKCVTIYGTNKSELKTVLRTFENQKEEFPSTQPDSGVRPRKVSGSFNQTEPGVKFEFKTREGLLVKLYKCPITKLNVDAIVNAANDKLQHVGGVAEVIAKAAGPNMNWECNDIIQKKRCIPEGRNTVTCAGNLPYKAIIHAVGPRWHDYPDKFECLSTLKVTIVNILDTAKHLGFKSVGMPPISSGIFAVPKSMCAAMYLSGILDFSEQFKPESLKEFHIIDIHDDVLDEVEVWYEKYKSNHFCLDIKKVLDHASYSHHLHKGGNMRTKERTTNQNDNRVGNRSSFSESTKGRDKARFINEGGQPLRSEPREYVDAERRYNQKRFCEKTDILIYTTDALTLKEIDVIAVSEDPEVTGSGALSTTLLDAGDSKYRKEHDKLKRWFWNHRISEVMLTTGGDNLPFRNVIHAVIRRTGETENLFQKNLQTTLNKILERANNLGNPSKKNPGRSIKLALPMIGLGSQKSEEVLSRCCWSFKDAITNFFKKIKITNIKEIHLINHNDFITKALIEAFKTRSPPNPKFTRSHQKDEFEVPKTSKEIDTWKMKMGTQKQTDVLKFMNSLPKPKRGNLLILDDDLHGETTNCVVCMSEMEDPVELTECKHAFCKECISEVLKSKPSCPVCGMIYGVVYGDQPRDGVAHVFEEDESLPGYEKKKTYVIYYEFPPGKQAEFHPEPGKPYEGIKRRAFLPKEQTGTEVLNLLRKAFEQGLTFTIGASRTTGKEGVITWNDIHHKTSRTGGPQKFGYPDDDYLSRVKEELACKGITSDN